MEQEFADKVQIGQQAADETQPAAAAPPSSAPFGGFNLNATAFVPNFNAPVFVPTGVVGQVGAPTTTTTAVPVKAAPVKATTARSASPEKPAVKKPAAPPTATTTTTTTSTTTKPPSKTPSSNKEAALAATVVLPPTAEEIQAEEEFFEATKGEKQHYNVVFIGHVDAGKSTMGGHILLLTGMVDKRTMEKYEREAKEQNRESWYLSWALDTNDEERAKGKTVEYGRAYFETEHRRFTILDAPGHKNYVPHMISGASQADVGVLVISARRGEFETGFERGGQTREHAMLAKTAGIKRLIVVINKMDDSTVGWDKARYDECCAKLLPYLKGCGYNPNKDLDFMPISGFTGANLLEPLTKDVCPWYSGPSLLQFLDTMTGVDRMTSGRFMMPISEKFKDMGTIVAGKVESGHIKKGQSVVVMPNKKVCEISTVYSELDEEKEYAAAGDNVRLRLKGIEEEEISSGSVLCDVKKPVHTVQHFEAQLMIMEHKNIICAGYNAILHVHTCVEEVSIGALLQLVDKKTGRRSKRPPPFVKKGQVCIARIECADTICLETYEEHPQLGRFTLRDEGKTVAIGKVTRLIEASEQ